MKKKLIVLSILVLIATMGGFFYSKPEKIDIRIAVVGPMTGKYAVNGESFVQGIQLCLQNMKCLCPSKKISINIDVFDDQNNADKAYETVFYVNPLSDQRYLLLEIDIKFKICITTINFNLSRRFF
jgi:ABC-type branched-chain amino acid transport systems, periplasmic component